MVHPWRALLLSGLALGGVAVLANPAASAAPAAEDSAHQVDLGQPLPASCRMLRVAPTPQERQQLAPTGRLRVTINTGNFVLTKQQGARIAGLSVDLSQVLGNQLGVPIEAAVVPSAALDHERVEAGLSDLGFFGVSEDRARGGLNAGPSHGVTYAKTYIQILGSYMVRAESPITDNSQVDQPGNTIVVGKGAVYALWLKRNLRYATLFEAPTSPEVRPTMLSSGHSIGAGIRNQLLADVTNDPRFRILDGHFMVINQAMATATGRPQAIRYLNRFVDVLNHSRCLEQLAISNQLSGYRLPGQTPGQAPGQTPGAGRKNPLQF